MAASTSTIECCFKNTVEMQIKTAAALKATFHIGVWKRLIVHDVHQTATEPMT